MKRILMLLTAAMFSLMLCGCFGNEPNDTAYIAALGIDPAQNGNYYITIQFARPTQISGGSSEEGGKGGSGIVENISVEAPDIYSALNIANHVVSKKFSLSHAKLVVFSRETARSGIKEVMETLGRSDEVRPDLITAVSRETAREYLENAQPLVELNPAKYYQLIYEENDSGGVPKKTGLETIFEISGDHRDTVMPLSGVAKASSGASQGSGDEGDSKSGDSGGGGEGDSKNSGSESGQSSSEGSSGGSSGGSGSEGKSGGNSQSGQSQSEENQQKNQDSKAPINEEGFQYKTRDYKAGEVKLLQKDKSEVLGMAVFNGDKLVAELGETEADIYNILNGDYKDNYTAFYSSQSPENAVTVRLNQRRRPIYKIDKDKKKVKIKLYLEGNLYSLPYDYEIESEIEEFEENTAKEISRKSAEFVEQMRDEYDADVLGIGEKARKCFINLKQFDEYNWEEKFKDYTIEVETKFKVRHSGIVYRQR